MLSTLYNKYIPSAYSLIIHYTQLSMQRMFSIVDYTTVKKYLNNMMKTLG